MSAYSSSFFSCAPIKRRANDLGGLVLPQKTSIGDNHDDHSHLRADRLYFRRLLLAAKAGGSVSSRDNTEQSVIETRKLALNITDDNGIGWVRLIQSERQKSE
jgi:hypothetical protein